MLRVLKFGYVILWRSTPPQRRCLAYPQLPVDLAFGHRTADSGVANGFVRELSPSAAAQAADVSPSFVVHHPKDRLVVDFSDKNGHMQDRPFSYDNLPRFASQLLPGDHLVSWDISDAFMHISRRTKRRPYVAGFWRWSPTSVSPYIRPRAPFSVRRRCRFWATSLTQSGASFFCPRPGWPA